MQIVATGDLLVGKNSRMPGTDVPEPEQLSRSVEKVGLLFQDARIQWLKLKPARKG